MQAYGKNVQGEIRDGKLILEIDLNTTIGPSKSGKTTLVGTTNGTAKLDDDGLAFNINVFRGH